ncbi:gluconolactonase [Bryobacterales bacterium F-183]|nr:gluconolactonase [Bryobacterales bacterium F-183]
MYVSAGLAGLLAAVSLFAWQQDNDPFGDVKIQKLAEGYRYLDSPLWTPERRLLFTEPATNTIHIWNPGHKPEPQVTNSNGARGITFDAQDRFYICESRARRVVRLDKKGKRDVLAERWEGKRLNGPNDIVVRKDGNVYFTDAAFGSAAVGARELDFHGIYGITPKGELQLIAKWKTGRPNGIALSPQGRHLYVSNSDERKIVAFDLDKNGAATNERTLISGIKGGVPGGIRCDEKGNLYVASKGLTIYDAQGKHLRDFPLPEAATNMGFGEGDLMSLFVSTQTSIYRVRLPYQGYVPYLNPPQAAQ